MKNELGIFEYHERPVVSTRDIAEHFGKSHSEVLKTINGEMRNGVQTAGLFERLRSSVKTPDLYFKKTYYEDVYGRKQPEYLCSRDGFTLLVMGFTGDKALKFKVAYINAFNAMEDYIRDRQSTEWLLTRKQGKLIRRSETDTLANLIEYAESQGSRNMRKTAYQNYTKLVNNLVGIQAGQRDKVPFKIISTIAFLEDMILHVIDEEISKGTHYKEIYQICKRNGEAIVKFAYLPELPNLSLPEKGVNTNN